jgi:hypothetical protein
LTNYFWKLFRGEVTAKVIVNSYSAVGWLIDEVPELTRDNKTSPPLM